MLKYKINNKNAKLRYDKINAYSFYSYSGETMTFLVEGYGKILQNDIISFSRNDGDFIAYEDSVTVEDCNSAEETQEVSCNSFKDIKLNIVSVDKKTINGTTYIFLMFDKEHYANANRKDIKGIFEPEEHILELCEGDLFVRYNYFVFEKYDNTSRVVNTPCKLIWYDTFGEKHVSNGLVPCLLDGFDMKKTLMFEENDETFMLYSNYKTIDCYVNDLRFFTYQEVIDEENKFELILKPGVIVSVRKGDPFIELRILNDFSPYLSADGGVSDFLNYEAEKRIVGALDYEKQQFSPVIYYDGRYIDVQKIVFYPYLRYRDEEWNVINNYGWYDLDEPGQNVFKNNIFSEEDIYYQHKCVSETFLRLSFYDSINKGTQKLLYTAKLYLDDNMLWTEYVKNGAESVALKFITSNKNDYSHKTEGFYIHLFPGNIKELEEGGLIYLKFELCHAKYGKTIPLSITGYPNVSGGTPDLEYIEKTYLKMDGDDKMYTDMQDLYNDMYIKVLLKYDFENFRYVWLFENAVIDSANELKIKLLEPKMF